MKALKDDSYKTLSKKGEALYKEKGSKFYAYAHPVEDENEAEELIDRLSREHHRSRHVCYAWALGKNRDRFRENDAGEPSGTAGKPIYGQLMSHEITNVLLVVVRYFGGTKLGTSGLINAYKTSAKAAIEDAGIHTKTIKDQYEIIYEYDATGDVRRILNKYAVQPKQEEFKAKCKAVLSVRKRNSPALKRELEKLPDVELNPLKKE